MRTLQEELKCMREGLHYDAHTPEMYAYRAEVKKKLHQLNVTEYHTSKMPEVTFPEFRSGFFCGTTLLLRLWGWYICS